MWVVDVLITEVLVSLVAVVDVLSCGRKVVDVAESFVTEATDVEANDGVESSSQ